MQEGENSKQLYPIPSVIRFSDGEYFETGNVINFGLKMYIIKSIYISNDLQMIHVAVLDPEITLEEELMLKLEELAKVPDRSDDNAVLNLKCKKAAQENRSVLLPILYQYPFHIKRIGQVNH